MMLRFRGAAVAVRASAALGTCMVIAACAGTHHSGTSTRSAVAAKPVRSDALPAGVQSATAVEPNGYVWVLAGNSQARTLTQLQLSTGGKTATEPVSASATSVAQSARGQLAVGTATPTSGTVELLNPAGQHPATLPMGGPVQDVAFGAGGNDVYVLNGTSTSRSVTVVDVKTRKAISTVGVSASTVAAVPNPAETVLWSLTKSGTVTATTLSSKTVATSLSVGNPGIAIAVAPAGNTLYVLKGTASTANIAVIDPATSAIKQVLPAAAHSVDLGISVNSNQLYDYVGAATYGNVQVFNLPTASG